VNVSAQTGDLIVWDSRLPHANSKNASSEPRIAFYLMMATTEEALRWANVASWVPGVASRGGAIVPVMTILNRGRPPL
jgi:ectoine hydroxylase-related dioxygenase (phytanoyl-CoA dioxygenase family)